MKIYHKTDKYGFYGIIDKGYIDPRIYNRPDDKYNVIWFSILNDDFSGNFEFSFELDDISFNQLNFSWVNEHHLVTPNKIYLNDSNLKFEVINDINIYRLSQLMHESFNSINSINTLLNLDLSKLNIDTFLNKLNNQFKLTPN